MLIFLSNVPIWVFPLFLLLVFIGWRATRNRRVPLMLFYALPLLGILTLRNIASLNAELWVWALAAIAYAASMAAGWVWQSKWTVSKTTHHVQVQGEWVTFTAMMVLFASGFVQGVLQSIAPGMLDTHIFQGVYASMVSLASGQFLGRSAFVLKM